MSMSFEEWLTRKLQAAVPGGQKVSPVSGEGLVSVRLADGGTVSSFVRQGVFYVELQGTSKKKTADAFDAILGALEELEEAHYVLTVDVNATDALREGAPAVWVYSAQVTVTYRRGVDWSEVD